MITGLFFVEEDTNPKLSCSLSIELHNKVSRSSGHFSKNHLMLILLDYGEPSAGKYKWL